MRALLAFSFIASTAFAADTWDSPFPGVRHLHRTGPANVNIHAAVVDLCAPGVSVRHTAFDERAQRTSAFATTVGAQVAMNADFWCRPVDVGSSSSFPPCIGLPAYTTYGVAAHAGQAWPNTFSLDALLAFGADRVQVFDDEEDQPFAPWMTEALSGHWSLIRDGVLLPNDCPIDPRSAIGLGADRHTLIMAIADGRNGWRGMTCLEMGQLLLELGAHRGFALDSGGSTTMWLQGQGVLNHPSDGSERVVGSHLAIFADGTSRPPFCQVDAPVVATVSLPALRTLGPPGRFHALNPTRLFDTRSPSTSSALVGLMRDAQGRVAAQSTFTFEAFSSAGIPTDATALSASLAVDDAAGDGYATMWPSALTQPTASTLNFAARRAISNGVLLGLPTPSVRVFAFAAAQFIADTTGYFSSEGAGFVVGAPTRLLDTRAEATLGLRADQPRVVVAPSANPSVAIALGLTALGGNALGYLTVFPCGAPRPTASALNFGVATPSSALTFVKSGPQGVCVVSSVDTHVIVDQFGSFEANTGLSFQPVEPTRWVDTRSPGGAWFGRTAKNAPLTLDVRSALPMGARAVVLNVTATNALDDGYLTVYPCDGAVPTTSNLNYAFGQTIAAQVVTSVGAGSICVVTNGRANLIIDVTGVFVPRAAVPDAGTAEMDAGLDAGPADDAGVDDAGLPFVDAGERADAGSSGPTPKPMQPCGCSSGAGLFVLLAVLLLRRRQTT